VSKEIFQILKAYKPDEHQYALATVVYVAGSSYRRIGARMLVSENGEFTGGISGGCLEGDALKRARLAILTDKPSIIRYDTSQNDAHQIGVGLGCNGIIDVLFVPVKTLDQNNPLNILAKRLEPTRELISTLTIIKNANQEDLGISYDLKTNFPPAFLHLKAEITKINQTQIFKVNEETELLIEHIPPPLQVYIFGNQYDIYPLIELLKYMAWVPIVVSQPSKLKKTSDFEIIDIEKINDIMFDEYSVALLMSHSFETDKKNLACIISKNLKYIGLLGPKVRSEKILAELNISSENQELHFPMGLDIGAQTPEEIAQFMREIKNNFK
jgi:xanthine dehydrogenase accessory factor